MQFLFLVSIATRMSTYEEFNMSFKKGDVQKYHHMNSVHEFYHAKIKFYFPLSNATTIQVCSFCSHFLSPFTEFEDSQMVKVNQGIK